ncbi:hypothetical protein ES703_111367 [subsurface metagenome]
MPYPPQGVVGVSDFLGLADTPGAYAGQAALLPAVNALENALEFVAGAPTPQYPMFTNTVIFGPAVKNDTWESLDCGVGPAIVYIKVELDANRTGTVKMLPNDEANELVTTMIGTHYMGTTRVGYVMAVTDSAGLVKWLCDGDVDAGNTTLTMMGYWTGHTKADALVFSGAGGAAWADMLIGPPNALCILKITTTDGNPVDFVARIRGETQDMEAWNWLGCTTAPSLPTGQQSYILVVTDAEGYIQRKNTNARTYTVHLVTHISGATFPKMGVFNGDAPAVWQDVDTPFGRAFAFIRHYHKADAGHTNAAWRENGETFPVNPAMSILVCTGNLEPTEIGYVFVPLDENGLVEWEGDGAHSSELRVEALCQ